MVETGWPMESANGSPLQKARSTGAASDSRSAPSKGSNAVDDLAWADERDILIGPGETVTFRVDLVGTLGRVGDYVLEVRPQTMVNPDTPMRIIQLTGPSSPC